MSDLAKRLTDLWEIPEAEREKGVKLLSKIFNNILNNPNDPKFRDLNFSKIRKKLDQCRPAFYLLFTAGFNQSVDGSRLQWQNNQITRKLLQDANTGLLAKINGEDVNIGNEYGSIVDPTETSIITDRTMNVKRKKKEKEKLEKLQKQSEQEALQKDLEKIEKMETDATAANEDNADKVDDVDMDDEEMRKAMAMSMEQDDGNENVDESNANDKDKGDGDGNEEDVAMEDKSGKEENVSDQLKEAGLCQEDLDLIEQIKAAKGITVTLNASDLKGLSKEEKIAKFQDVRDKYRKEKQQNIVRQKLEKERRRRDNIKKAQEAERKRKEYEMRMVASRKKREKAEAERRKKAIKEKIAADKKRRAEQKAREQKKKEAEKQAKLKAQQQQNNQ